MKENLHSKGCKNKEKCDLYGKEIEDKRDVVLCTGRESRGEKGQGFVFKKGNKNDGGAENSGIFSRDIASQGRDNFVLLTCQYQIIISSIVIQTFLNRSC